MQGCDASGSGNMLQPSSVKPSELELKRRILGNYTPFKRTLDIFNTVCFALLFVAALCNIVVHTRIWSAWLCAVAFFSSLLVCDFLSGVIHWVADTWGNYETPVIGPTLIRSFREHHISPQAMTKHDVFETNGDSCFVTLLPLFSMSRQSVLESSPVYPYTYFSMCFVVWLCLWAALTNQFHSWSHNLCPPRLVRFLQSCGLILSPKAHREHHVVPYDQKYCISTGWCNPVLEKLDFWRRLEALVTRWFKLIPREDDMKWTGISGEQPTIVADLLKGGERARARAKTDAARRTPTKSRGLPRSHLQHVSHERDVSTASETENRVF